ncbi:MAG TPA: hypothetical protein VD993_02510 [Chitinophagaceae bacterium]|nr:hypothetical protein [Chitinophagaceae bacterium]
MAILKKVLVIVLTLVLLTGLKHLLDRYNPTSIIFHYNLLTCIQYFLLMGVLLWLVLYLLFRYVFKRSLRASVFWIIFLLLLGGCEGFFYYVLRNSEKTSGRLHALLTEYYLTYEINFPQLSYDSVLSYTLKKNAVYDHDNIEFSNQVHANKQGLRDDNASLVKPSIICLGDSYTMGWGVKKEEAFPELIEHKTGLRVLNAGITSYGTARQLLLLNRLDTANLQYLVIQYCYNDYEENKAFLESGRYLPAGSRQTQERTHASYQLARTYFPFKYTLTLCRMYLRDQLSDRSDTAAHARSYVQPSASALLEILYKSNCNFRKWKIFIIDTNRYPAYDHYLLESVESLLKKNNFSDDFRKSIHIVKFPELNKQRYFYPLDNHLNREGHEFVANQLLSAMQLNGRN